MKKKISLKDIAKEVGVSIATVSYVLSKGKDSRITPEVSAQVKKAAKKLNYQPNQIAKSLKMGKTFTIGLIVADISNPFFAQIARIIEDEAAKRNYTVIFGSSDEKPNKSLSLIQFLTNRQVDGFIIAPTEGSEKQLINLQKQGMPFVLIDRNFPKLETNYVVIDNFTASFQAVQRLVKNGSSKIGMIAYDTSLQHMEERIRGYRAVMDKNNLSIEKNWLKQVIFQNLKEEVQEAIDDMIQGKNKIDAIFFATNTLAIHGLKYLGTLKYKVPSDIAIISFDEGEAFDLYYCPLTFVRQPLEIMGRKAVEILTEQIANPKAKKHQICLEAELVVRQSCSKD